MRRNDAPVREPNVQTPRKCRSPAPSGGHFEKFGPGGDRCVFSRSQGLHDYQRELLNMGIIVLLIVGGVVGWLASLIMRTDAQQGIFLNIVVGIVGALIAGFVVTPLIGGAPITSGVISVQSVLISLVGAVILLAVINLVRRGSVR
jgi:uncharacterized membrane protein YeaQ/YmgE (transglycosylase-associated protein family)